MKTSSLKFRLLLWYAAMLACGFVLLGLVTYLVLQNSLVSALQESQWRRSRQISQLLSDELKAGRGSTVGEHVEARYSPALNERFVRISQRDGVTLYLSSGPTDHSFEPATLPPPVWPSSQESAVQVQLLGGRKMLVASHRLTMPGGKDYLIETGAPMDAVQADLRKWLWFLAALLPLVLIIALGGGYVLVRRALLPVERIAGSAEHISSHNLSERLPVPHTGDELERLSVALNHMIERLDSAFQHSRQFVADASHELRTPLTVLRGELESLAEVPQLNAAGRERLGSALEELDRLTRIVEGLFAISRLDAGEATTEWLPLDLTQLASSTAEQMSLLAEDKDIHVTCAGPMGVWVAGDRARLKQVVVNLLDNAIKYTPEGGTVSMSVGAHDSKAVLEVADTGLGIPPDALPRVFERFFRVDKARAREQGGAGLGLAIVKSICTAHHGRVEVSSSPGRGSRFRVELPLAGVPNNNHNRHN